MDTSFPADGKLVLFDHPMSPCARRVRITMLEKGLRWETRNVDLEKMEQKRPEYLALNPNGVVPTLLHGHKVVYESNVITRYLDDIFPQVRLYPVDPVELAEVQKWQQFELSFAKDYRPLMYQRLLGVFLRASTTFGQALERVRRQNPSSEHLEWETKVWQLDVLTPEEEKEKERNLYSQLDVLEEYLKGKDYLVGGRFTQADLSVYPRVRMYPYVRMPIAPRSYPNLTGWMERLAKRPSFQKSQSLMETAIQQVSRTMLVPWLATAVQRPAEDRSPVERLATGLLKQIGRRDLDRLEIEFRKRLQHRPS